MKSRCPQNPVSCTVAGSSRGRPDRAGSSCRHFGKNIHRSPPSSRPETTMLVRTIAAPENRRGSCLHRRWFRNASALSKKLESPRIPLVRPKSVKSVSPLVDPESPFSLPESEADRLRWLNRFTPRWNETSNERRRRFKQRAECMRTRRAHVRRVQILNYVLWYTTTFTGYPPLTNTLSYDWPF